MQGKIIKGIGGFYYVHDEISRIYECRAKGIFRLRGQKPLVGDEVDFEILDEREGTGNVREILPRKNSLIRPAVANVDQALLVAAVRKPSPAFNLLDRFLIMMEEQQIPTLICFNKQDLAGDAEKEKCRLVYAAAGYPIFFVSAAEKEGIEELAKCLAGKTTVMAGPSGVGKSTLMNLLCPGAAMETGAVSEKIGRGRHTTRHSELFYLGKGSFVFDTPGFASLSVFAADEKTLAEDYPEFERFRGKCRFPDCVHIRERECGVQEAVEAGNISTVRYENYRQFYRELKEMKKY